MKIYIDKSKTHGKGLFAKKNIKKGEIVFIIKGKKINFLIDSEKQAKKAGLNWVGIGKNTWVDPNLYCQYFNHSCSPNTYIKGRVTVVASRNIKKGEEINFDYSFDESDVFWKMKCNCGNKNCRKTITSIQLLPQKIFKENKNYIPKYYQKVYKKFNLFNFKNINDMRDEWVGFISKDFKV